MSDLYQLLIVDDSALIRKALRHFFIDHPHIQVVGEAANGQEALQAVQALKPNVITLDINMPEMDGLTALKHLMIQAPTPTVMLSTLTYEGASETFDALRYGAVDFITKPDQTDGTPLYEQAAEIVQTVSLAATVTLHSVQYIRTVPPKKTNGRLQPKGLFAKDELPCNQVVIIGAAEGSYGTLLRILPHLQHAPVAYLVVLHTASRYVDAFAHYLNRYSKVTVQRAHDGQPLMGGQCYLASGEEYVTLHPRGNPWTLHVNPAPFTSRRGTIDMLMFSAAETLQDKVTGVILSGAGQDGSEGIEEIERLGGHVLIQSPDSCLYKDMAYAALARSPRGGMLPDWALVTVLNEWVQ